MTVCCQSSAVLSRTWDSGRSFALTGVISAPGDRRPPGNAERMLAREQDEAADAADLDRLDPDPGPNQALEKAREDSSVPGTGLAGKGQRVVADLDRQRATARDGEVARAREGPGVTGDGGGQKPRTKGCGQRANQRLGRAGNAVGQDVVGGALPRLGQDCRSLSRPPDGRRGRRSGATCRRRAEAGRCRTEAGRAPPGQGRRPAPAGVAGSRSARSLRWSLAGSRRPSPIPPVPASVRCRRRRPSPWPRSAS
jgi:hypothetical protein